MEESELNSLQLEIIDWYSRQEIVFELVKLLKNRETVFISPFSGKATRMMKIHCLNHWKAVCKWMNFYHKIYNLFYSLAKYDGDGIPNQVFDFEARKPINRQWTEDNWKHITGFDMMIDFDCDNDKQCEEVKKDVLKVSELLKDVPHSIRFSGCGFHIIISSEFLFKPLSQEWYNPDKIISFYSLWEDILKALQKDYCGLIDIGITDSRRVCKVPYSLALYEEGAYVCYPYFKHSEISEILIPQFTTSWILSSTSSIRNRGVPILNLEKVNDADPSAAMRLVCQKLLGANKWSKYEKLINNDKSA